MKPPLLGGMGNDHHTFPGHYCPGLIEAPRHDSGGPVRWPFRGITAPASLKRLYIQPCGRGRKAFRGITAPASLKLEHLGGDGAGDRPFRGITAPASLKPPLPPSPLPARRFPFRGITAPASLKPTSSERSSPPAPPFRGITAPASLKRSGGPPDRAYPGGLSGALLPRPH